MCTRRDWVQAPVRQTHDSLYQRKLRRFCSRNPFGTRYRPCKAAAEGLANTTITPSRSGRPSRLAYWYNPPSPSFTSTYYIYRLFPNRISSFPPSPYLNQPITRPATGQLPASNTTTRNSRPRSEFDADGNPIGKSANSPAR